MKKFLRLIAIATTAIISGCATANFSANDLSPSSPNLLRAYQGKFVKAIPVPKDKKQNGAVGVAADTVAFNTGNATVGAAAIAISLLDSFGGSDNDKREIHLQDEVTDQVVIFEVDRFQPSAAIRPEIGDVMRFVFLKDGNAAYVNLTKNPELRKFTN